MNTIITAPKVVKPNTPIFPKIQLARISHVSTEEFDEYIQSLDPILITAIHSKLETDKIPHMRFFNLLKVADWARQWFSQPITPLDQTQVPNLLQSSFLAGDFEKQFSELTIKNTIFNSLVRALQHTEPNDLNHTEAIFMQELRNIRKQAVLHIAYRDINQLDTLECTLQALSFLSCALIDAALTFCYEQLTKKHGSPRDPEGLNVQPIIIGMGKLGGEELNFSSDVDLMVAYRANGETDGHKSIENQLFFNRMTQYLVKILDTSTSDGFVYRVDLRLRPFGESGSLSMSISGFEDYYLRHGRDWERYALIKARPIAGNIDEGEQLLNNLRPFVYRKYIDYATIDALRDMKAMIAHEVIKKGLKRNVKLGPGGIREIEFIGQSFQLIYGGREINMRSRQIIPTLLHLQTTQKLSEITVHELLCAYTFLRQIENRLQLKNDQQTHDLPINTSDKMQLAWSMGYNSWAEFIEVLLIHVEKVKHVFGSIFGDIIEEGETAGFVHDFNGIWRQQSKRNLQEWLQQRTLELSTNNSQANEQNDASRNELVASILMDFYQNIVIKSSLASQKQLEKLIPLALITLEKENRFHELDHILPLFLGLIDVIHRRTTYLALLTENPKALSQLLELCTQSPWIMRYLAKYPFLLDELLAPANKRIPLNLRALNKEISRMISQVDNVDIERKLEALRDFHHAHILKVAMADISNRIPLMIVSDHLSEIAEVILNKILKLAWSDISARYGEPSFIDAEQIYSAEFAIIAYGKLGGLELGYGSDLDIVFIHNSRGSDQITRIASEQQRSVDNTFFFMKLAQKIIYYLTTQTTSGILYNVDTRLRPSGHSGLLVSSIDTFLEYQMNSAWTWEHQALIRARFVAGNQSLGKQFSAVRRTILSQKRNLQSLKIAVKEMREKISAQQIHATDHHKNSTKQYLTSQIKTDAGGIVDIEFIVQYLVLAHAHHSEVLIKFTDNIRQLAGLEATGIISSRQAMILRDAYRELRAHSNRAKLKEVKYVDIDDVLRAKINHVIEIWTDIFG